MIIGEKINQYQHHEHEEDNYDYLFKKKNGASGPRQQKKARKGKRRSGQPAGPRIDQRSAGAFRNRLILQNFGLFNKKKNQRKAEAAAQDALATPEGSILPDAPTVDDTAQEQEMTPTPDMNAPAIPADTADSGSTAGNENEDDSNYDETAGASKNDPKTPAKKKDAKDSGPGVWIGWAFLGLTVVVIGYTMYRLDKMEAQLPHNNDLHPNH